MTLAHSHAAPLVSRILLASDFSPRAEHAAWYARMFAGVFQAQLWVTHAVVPSVPPDAALLHSDGAMQYAAQHMERFAACPPLQGLEFETVVRTGALWEVLSQAASEHNIDLIIAGTHGRGDLGRALLGSTAELILRNAFCPVLTVSPHVAEGPPDERVLRIVFPVGAARFPARALAYATRFANQTNAQLIFVHVVHSAPGAPVDYPDVAEIEDSAYLEAMELLKRVVPDCSVFRREPELLVESGMPGETIVTFARRSGADLILMPVKHAATASRNHAVWKTASWVVAHAGCPVLTLGE